VSHRVGDKPQNKIDTKFKRGHTPHNKKHGMAGSKTYQAWHNMINRCYNEKSINYKYYGKRGITVCDRWKTFENFYNDIGSIPEGMTLDRIDNISGYIPENCRIVSMKEQSINKRLRTDNKSGIAGVNFIHRDGVWRASIDNKYIGSSNDFFEACCLRKSAENKRRKTCHQ